MADDALFPADFERRAAFMLEPLRGFRPLPKTQPERIALIDAACDWLDRFLAFATETRHKLLNRALNPDLSPHSEATLLHSTDEPIPGWDWQAEQENSDGPNLFDPEIIERAAYLIEQMLGDAGQPFFRELALLEVDRLDLLSSLLQGEFSRLKAI